MLKNLFFIIKKKKHIFKANILRLIFRLIRYADFKFYVDKHKKLINSYLHKLKWVSVFRL